MEFPQLTALVPSGEHHDFTALNEGIWLSAGHIANIENALATAATNATTATTATVDLQQQLQTANDSLTAANTRISELEGEVSGLKKQPHGSFQATTSTQDKPPVASVKEETFMTSFDKELAAMRGVK